MYLLKITISPWIPTFAVILNCSVLLPIAQRICKQTAALNLCCLLANFSKEQELMNKQMWCILLFMFVIHRQRLVFRGVSASPGSRDIT